MRVLVVEDSPLLGQFLERGLQQEGHAPLLVRNLTDARAALESHEIDALVLDRKLPDGDGIDLLTELREAQSKVLVIMLTGQNDPENRLEGLREGADDYLGKPFSFEELMLRLNRLVYRYASTHGIVVGDLQIDPSGHQVQKKGETLNLTAKEFALLLVLATNQNQVVSASQLLAQVWGLDELDFIDRVHVYILRLRKKIGEDYIRTVRGVGYVLEATRQS
jgi:two-component system OmpR family response regulator